LLSVSGIPYLLDRQNHSYAGGFVVAAGRVVAFLTIARIR
jgi:hypothetical protein